MDPNSLDEVEDYSSEPTHDQLPSVEEAISSMGISTPRKNAPWTAKKWGMCVGATVGVLVLLFAVVLPLARRDSGTVKNIEAAVKRMALDPSSDFSDETSYQSKAMAYLVEDSTLPGEYTYKQLTQRYAMYCLYFATTPGNWEDASGWKRKGVSECEWDGVTCGKDDIWVTRIELKDNGLAGEVPEEMTLMPYLDTLNIKTNDITGTIPSGLCSLPDIEIKVDCDEVSCDCCYGC